MHCTEMAFHTGLQFVVDYVVHLQFKTTFLLCCRCHIFGILAAAKKDVELLLVFCFEQGADLSVSAGELEFK